MSDDSIPFQPAIDEPSKTWPSVNLSSTNAFVGTETCCSLPRVSVKRRSTNLTSLSAIIFITSLADVIDVSPRSKWKFNAVRRRPGRPNERVTECMKHAVRGRAGYESAHHAHTGRRA